MQAKYKWLLVPPALALILFLGPLRGSSGAPNPASNPPPAAEEVTQQPGSGIPPMPGMDQLISTLLGVLILGSIGIVVFARMRKPKITGTSTLVEHRQSLRITPKHHVHVLEFDSQLFLVGTSEAGVNVLKISESLEDGADEMEIAHRENEEDEGAVPKDLIIPRPPARKAKARSSRVLLQEMTLVWKHRRPSVLQPALAAVRR